MADFGMKIKRQDILKDVEDCDPKELVFSSKYPCLKLLQVGKREYTVTNGTSPIHNIVFDSVLTFPVVLLVFLYDPGDSSYKALGSVNVLDHTQDYRGSFWFDDDDFYVQIENYTGSDIDTHIIFFVGYA